MTRRGWMWLTAAITAAVIGLVLWLQAGPPAGEVPQDVVGPEAIEGSDGAVGGDGAPGDGEAGAASAADDESREPAPGSPSRREWLERAIRIAREERLAAVEVATGGEDEGEAQRGAAGAGAGELGTLDAEYIRAAVQELKPLLAECYELARGEQTDLEGRLVVEFEIVGEPEVGGIVDQSSIDQASDLDHPVLVECVRETMYTAELPAPEGGGRVTVRYPFNFSPE